MPLAATAPGRAQNSRQSPWLHAYRRHARPWSPPTTRSRPCRAHRLRPHRRDGSSPPRSPPALSCGVSLHQLARKEQHERPLLQPAGLVGVGDGGNFVRLVHDVVGEVVGLQQRNGAAALHLLIDAVIVDRASLADDQEYWDLVTEIERRKLARAGEQ